MIRFILSLFVLFLSFPPLASARWIGSMLRDYTPRLLEDRISRDNIAATREARIIKRLSARTSGRTRAVPEATVLDPSVNRALAASYRTRRLLQRIEEGGQRKILQLPNGRAATSKIREKILFNDRRRSDLGEILDALRKYMASPDLAEEAEKIPTAEQEICKRGFACVGGVNLDDLFLRAGIVSVPIDPALDPAAKGTGYYVQKIGQTGLRVGVIETMNEGEGGEIFLEWTPIAE